jgi:phosphate transport system protein
MAMDSKVDHLRDQVLNELSFYIVKDPSLAPRVLKIGFIAQSLERIADHATNIAEMVIYLVEGRIVRHRSVPEE